MEKFVVICDSIRSLYNVGSIFRTADGAGVDKIYLCGITGRPDDDKAREKIAKVALGAEKTVQWEYVSQAGRIIKKLKSEGCQIIALEQAENSVDYFDFKPKFPLGLIIGNEVEGVKKTLLNKSDQIIEIPMRGVKESLNVSISFGIAAYWIGNFKVNG